MEGRITRLSPNCEERIVCIDGNIFTLVNAVSVLTYVDSVSKNNDEGVSLGVVKLCVCLETLFNVSLLFTVRNSVCSTRFPDVDGVASIAGLGTDVTLELTIEYLL